jgi:hypothetical protein
VTLIFIFGAYALYNKYSSEKYFYNLPKNTKELFPYQVTRVGPVLVEAPCLKFGNKFQSREEYHKWLENDIRTFSK